MRNNGHRYVRVVVINCMHCCPAAGRVAGGNGTVLLSSRIMYHSVHLRYRNRPTDRLDGVCVRAFLGR